ncbi:hypothetical protein, partial [Archangium sp.]|uniref:hypothetical protein n=1 Tax=Archangium sp. TaxID=1872627 RepID=UPI002D4C098A
VSWDSTSATWGNDVKISNTEQLALEPAPLVGPNGPNERVRVFWKGTDGNLYDTRWTGSDTGWQTVQRPKPLGSTIDSRLAPINGPVSGQMQVFWKGAAGYLVDTFWDGSNWRSAVLP